MSEQNAPPESKQLADAVTGIQYLRRLSKEANMCTSRAQASLLKALSPTDLARVALLLAEHDKAGRQ
jgi:hypothetical protein